MESFVFGLDAIHVTELEFDGPLGQEHAVQPHPHYLLALFDHSTLGKQSDLKISFNLERHLEGDTHWLICCVTLQLVGVFGSELSVLCDD